MPHRLAATGDYAFWLDADDFVIDPLQRGAAARELLAGLGTGERPAYVVRCALRPRLPGGHGARRSSTTSRLLPAPRRRPLVLPRPRADPSRPSAGRGVPIRWSRRHPSGTPAIPTRRPAAASWPATRRSCSRSWPTAPTIRSCSSTSARDRRRAAGGLAVGRLGHLAAEPGGLGRRPTRSSTSCTRWIAQVRTRCSATRRRPWPPAAGRRLCKRCCPTTPS